MFEKMLGFKIDRSNEF